MSSTRRGRRDSAAAGGLSRVSKARAQAVESQKLARAVTQMGIPLVVGYLVVSLTLGWVAGASYTAIIITIVVLARAAIRNREALGAWASLLVTVLVVCAIPQLSGGSFANINPAVLFAALAATVGAFMTRRHRGSRFVTTVIGHAGCVIGALISVAWQWQGGAVAVLWVAGVVLWRTGGVLLVQVGVAKTRSRLRSSRSVRGQRPVTDDLPVGGFAPDDLEAGIEAEQDTGAALEALPAEWSVLHSRALPGTRADVDHLVIGGPGVFVIDSKNWAGALTAESVLDDDGEEFIEYRINGSSDWLVERLSGPLFEAAKVAEVLSLPDAVVQPVIVFNERMRMPSDVVSVTVFGVQHPVTGELVDRQVHFVQLGSLVPWLTEQPVHLWRSRSRVGRVLDRAKGVDAGEGDREATGRYVHDLGVFADYAMPPA